MGKLAKKWIKAAAKTVPSSQWKERGLKKAWALQKKAQKSGGKAKKSTAKPKGKPRAKSNPKGGVSTSNKSRKIGAVIQSVKATQPLLSPAIHVVSRGGDRQVMFDRLRTKANAAYAGNVVATAVNQVVDRKIAQGAALSRGSITAWFPETFLALRVADQVKGQDTGLAIRTANRKMAKTINAYDPITGSIDLANKDFRTYQALKIGGGIARRLSNAGPFKRITAPMKRLLGEMGGAL